MTAQVHRVLWRHEIFISLAIPKRLSGVHFARYMPGMEYSDHIDNTLMSVSSGNPLRADMSMTIFLHQPDDYDGGELVLNSDTTPQGIKLSAGDAVFYPTGDFHRVDPVTRGERRVAVAWIQSAIRDPAQRQILMEMWMALDWIHNNKTMANDNDHPAFRPLAKARNNLLRMGAEV